MFENLAQDLRRCGRTRRERLREALLNPGVWAVIGYRYRRWVHTSGLPRLLRIPFMLVAVVVQLWTEITSNIQLPSSAQIGPGLSIPHTGYIVVNSRTVLGANCTLTQGVTIGHAGGGQDPSRCGTPMFGDRVYIGPGSAVIGPISIGDDSLIGVGTIVTRSIPARGVVAGNPARLLSRRGSFDLIWYPGMENDRARQASLLEAEAPAASIPRAEMVET